MADGVQDEIRSRLAETEAYLTNILLPFWLQNVADPDGDGYLTYFDASGRRGPQTEKTFLMQIRSLYTMASAHRQGYGQNISAELAGMGADFILDHYWDDKHDGWIWIADRAGNPTVYDKVGYGQCFAVYAFSEYCLATGDDRGRKAAERSYSVIRERMADSLDGYLELFERGFAHSIEAWKGDDLVGGLYGVHIGTAFMGESKFSRPDIGGTDASKICLVETVRILNTRDFELFDVQFPNPHLEQFGIVEIGAEDFANRLARAINRPRDW